MAGLGPGVLSDVIGIDTCVHASDVMAQGFPDRMPVPEPSALRERVNRGHLGQKSGQGFYRFEPMLGTFNASRVRPVMR